MTNLEQLLTGDSAVQEARKIKERLEQAQFAVKRQLDRGCAPAQFQSLEKQQKAYEAALAVVEKCQSVQ